MDVNGNERVVTFYPEGTCSERIDLRLRDGVIASAAFEGGCSGNLEGLARLVVGMGAAEAAARLRGIRCGDKDTSCPDQLARALESALEGD